MSATRYYRVIKEHPYMEVGGILRLEGKYYTPESELYVREDMENVELSDKGYNEYQAVVEKQPEWFERVYCLKKASKTTFGTRAEAKELLEKGFKTAGDVEDND